MIIPIGDENVKGGAKPIFSYAFIVINILIFLFQVSLGAEGYGNFLQELGAIPNEISNYEDLHTLITSIFLHGDIMHLAGNMLFLWLFADNIEATAGNLHFVFFYFLGGLIASMAQIIVDPSSTLPTVGASGAISAVMGAYIVCFPKSKIKMIVLIFFKSFYIPALLFLGFWFGQQIFSSFSIGTDSEQGGVAWWAHIGGFAFGVIYAFLFLKKKPKAEYNYV